MANSVELDNEPHIPSRVCGTRIIVATALSTDNRKQRSHLTLTISARSEPKVKVVWQNSEQNLSVNVTPKNVRNVPLTTHTDSAWLHIITYTQVMNRKTPPGFYFVLVLAILGFVFSSGVTRAPSTPLEISSISIPSGDGRVGVYLTSYALTKASVMDAVIAAREAGLIDTVVVNVKNMHGEVTYDTAVPLAHEIGSATGRINLGEALAELRSYGFYVVARQVLFFDPLLSRHLGLEADWATCDNQVACDYNLAIAAEVAAAGFDELQFDYIRFPDGGALEDVYASRFEAVTAFLAEANRQLGSKITLSADLFGRVMWPWNSRKVDPIGQSLEDMAPYLDFISPMVYPSHYYEESYRDDPYLTIQDALTSGSARVDANFRPYLQAFDRHLPEDMTLETYIAEQVQAAQDHGANGYLFWHPACEYGPLFRVLEPQI